MRKIYFFGIGILLVCLAGWGIYAIYKPHHNVEGEQAVAALSAVTLYNEFLKDEGKANQKWTGKVIEITGTISSVAETGNYVSINLAATPEGGVNCSILKNDYRPDKPFSKGDSITVKGKCTGFLMDVNLVDCVVKK
jgi:hypothetical protein